jgi:hypothetical protein
LLLELFLKGVVAVKLFNTSDSTALAIQAVISSLAVMLPVTSKSLSIVTFVDVTVIGSVLVNAVFQLVIKPSVIPSIVILLLCVCLANVFDSTVKLALTLSSV